MYWLDVFSEKIQNCLCKSIITLQLHSRAICRLLEMFDNGNLRLFGVSWCKLPLFLVAEAVKKNSSTLMQIPNVQNYFNSVLADI